MQKPAGFRPSPRNGWLPRPRRTRTAPLRHVTLRNGKSSHNDCHYLCAINAIVFEARGGRLLCKWNFWTSPSSTGRVCSCRSSPRKLPRISSSEVKAAIPLSLDIFCVTSNRISLPFCLITRLFARLLNCQKKREEIALKVALGCLLVYERLPRRDRRGLNANSTRIREGTRSRSRLRDARPRTETEITLENGKTPEISVKLDSFRVQISRRERAARIKYV